MEVCGLVMLLLHKLKCLNTDSEDTASAKKVTFCFDFRPSHSMFYHICSCQESGRNMI